MSGVGPPLYFDQRGRPRWSPPKHRWTAAEDAIIRDAYARGEKMQAIAASLGVSVEAVALRAQRHLGLHRSPLPPPTDQELLERFMRKVVCGRAGDGDCWRWIGARRPGGYGAFYMRDGVTAAHRAAYTLHRGPVPPGLFVCHHCDNPWCVNPDHLFVGTQLENVADCIQKGRKTSPPVTDWQNRTTPHHWQRLTPAQVMEILTRVRAGELQERIAADYGINSRTVSKIKLGQRWPQLSGQ